VPRGTRLGPPRACGAPPAVSRGRPHSRVLRARGLEQVVRLARARRDRNPPRRGRQPPSRALPRPWHIRGRSAGCRCTPRAADRGPGTGHERPRPLSTSCHQVQVATRQPHPVPPRPGLWSTRISPTTSDVLFEPARPAQVTNACLRQRRGIDGTLTVCRHDEEDRSQKRGGAQCLVERLSYPATRRDACSPAAQARIRGRHHAAGATVRSASRHDRAALSGVASRLDGGTLYGGQLAVGDDVLAELNSAI